MEQQDKKTKEMRIEVMKLIEVHEKDDKGNNLINSKNNKPVIAGYITKPESIPLLEIKSFRPWEKNSFQSNRISGEITILYLKGDESKETNAQMLIEESFDSFCDRTNTIRVNHEQSNTRP